jgi:hypothetical protein
MRGLPTCEKSSGCFGRWNSRPDSFITSVRRVFTGPPQPPVYPPEKQPQAYKHVPTHAAADHVRTTSSTSMKEAEEVSRRELELIEIRLEQ